MNRLSVLLMVGWLSAGTARADPQDILGAQAKSILHTHCVSCHGGGAQASKGGFGFVLDRDRLVSRRLVVPGQASQSDLLLRIRQGEMPPPAHKTRPSPAEQGVLQRWIDAHAPAFEAPAQVKVLTEKEMLAAIHADLEQLDPRRRRFTRYLTLNHLAAAGRTQHDLHDTRTAVAKLLNCLSWHPRLSMPESLAVPTILRLDLRAYKWHAGLWEKLVGVYPYRFPGDSAAARAIAKLTGSAGAVLRADWFVATASRPPLYHDLLQLPTSDRGLERLLQVDVPGNLHDDNVLRAGFNDSGVSKNNRLIERHDAAHGALWRSYDFEKNTGRQNLFEHPLGPNTGVTSFQAAGGEMIFHLPNGLQGYLLMDAQGRRIDKAPGEIVSDPRRPDQRVETGISCMSCHARGLLFKADQLRPHVEKNAQAFGARVVDAVRALHPRPAKFQAQIDEDNRRYQKALETFGVRDPEQEPINLVTARFEATLDGRTAAAELGLTLPEFTRLLKQERELARILGGLLTPGGTVQRQVFEEKFAEAARVLAAAQVAAAVQPAAPEAFTGHTGTVHAVAFSPDGQQAASGGDDRTVRLWEVASGKELARLQAGNAEVHALAFSRDGKFLLSGGRDRLLRLWDLQAGREVRVLQGHTDTIRAVAFSRDGQRLASGGDDRGLRLWDLASGRELAVLAGHAGPITTLAWSADGQHVLSGSQDGTARYWHVPRQEQRLRLAGHVGPVLSVALSPDGRTALTGGNDTIIRLWTLPDGKERQAFKGHANAVVAVQFAAGGDQFDSSSSQHQNADQTWRRWNVAKQTEIAGRALGADHRFGCAALAPDRRRILVGGPAGFLRLWSW